MVLVIRVPKIFVTCRMSTDLSWYNLWHSNTWIKYPTIWHKYCPPPLMCIPTLLWLKKFSNFHEFNNHTSFISTQIFLCSGAQPCAPAWTLAADISITCSDCLSPCERLPLLHHLQLRSRYGAKLQRAFLTFLSGVFLQICQNRAREQNKFRGNKTSTGC